jgi:hypothetical protein
MANKNVHCILTRDEEGEKLRPEVRSSLVKGGGKVTEERMEKYCVIFGAVFLPSTVKDETAARQSHTRTVLLSTHTFKY